MCTGPGYIFTAACWSAITSCTGDLLLRSTLGGAFDLSQYTSFSSPLQSSKRFLLLGARSSGPSTGRRIRCSSGYIFHSWLIKSIIQWKAIAGHSKYIRYICNYWPNKYLSKSLRDRLMNDEIPIGWSILCCPIHVVKGALSAIWSIESNGELSGRSYRAFSDRCEALRVIALIPPI